MADETNLKDKVESGVPGLDELMNGGFPPKTLCMIAGNTGAGKSLLALQFLYHGATKLNEPGVLISLEQPPAQIIKIAKEFGWDLEPLITKKKLLIISPTIYKFKAFEESIFESMKKIKAKRLVIDSYTIASTYFLEPAERRRSLLLLSQKIQKLDCVSLIVSDIPEGLKAFSISGFEEFVVDGILVLTLISDKSRNLLMRSILVRKMRYRNHSLKRVPFKITPKGGIVYPQEELF